MESLNQLRENLLKGDFVMSSFSNNQDDYSYDYQSQITALNYFFDLILEKFKDIESLTYNHALKAKNNKYRPIIKYLNNKFDQIDELFTKLNYMESKGKHVYINELKESLILAERKINILYKVINKKEFAEC